jgi:hypothetical protein
MRHGEPADGAVEAISQVRALPTEALEFGIVDRADKPGLHCQDRVEPLHGVVRALRLDGKEDGRGAGQPGGLGGETTAVTGCAHPEQFGHCRLAQVSERGDDLCLRIGWPLSCGRSSKLRRARPCSRSPADSRADSPHLAAASSSRPMAVSW